MSERRVKRLLDTVPVDRDAEERTWALVRAAYAEREPVPRAAPRLRWTLAVAFALLAAVVAAAAFSPPGRAVVDAVRRSIGVEHAAPALFRLPAPGRLLVSGTGGTWVVAADGSKRRLGGWRRASWSPHGLFVVAATATELAAIEPGSGDVHWSLARPQIAFPRWGGSRIDTRVAYLTRGRLHVVAGNGRGDVFVAAAAHVAPAWRPGDRHVLAFVTARGRVRVQGAWTSGVYAHPRAIAWSPDGSVLALATATRVVLFEAATGRAREIPVAGVRALAYSRNGRLAVLRDRAILELSSEGAVTLFGAPGRLDGLAWSPNGRFLLTALPGADQWVFVGKRRVLAVSNIAAQFGGVPSLDGWMPGA
jgi:hypothetical protein